MINKDVLPEKQTSSLHLESAVEDASGTGECAKSHSWQRETQQLQGRRLN